MDFQRHSVNLEAERRIAIHLITSSEFCKKVLSKMNIRYLQSTYIRRIVEWVTEYYDQYKNAPGKHIQDIFDQKKDSLGESERELISLLLTDLSTEFESLASVNVPYLVDTTFDFFRKRSLEIHNKEIEELIQQGDMTAAEIRIQKYRQIAKQISGWVDPFDKDVIFDTFEQEENPLFQFIGPLGNMVGSMERDWLVGIFGSMKKGKSWILEETAVQAAMKNLKVVFVSLEMNKTKVLMRLYKRLCGFVDHDRELLVPIFDCANNQNNSCIKKERACTVMAPLFDTAKDNDLEIVRQGYTSGYKPCTACRGISKDYATEVWYNIVPKKAANVGRVQRHLKGLVTMHGRNIRVICYPAFSATLPQMENDIYMLEVNEDFIPDVVVIDYADIVKPDEKGLEGRDVSDYIWKRLKGMSSLKHTLVVTASQLNRGSMLKKNVSGIDIAEDIRKLAHVDIALFMNQTPVEKRKGVMRLSYYHRHREFDEFHQAMTLQSLAAGQPLLDSEVIYVDVSDSGD